MSLNLSVFPDKSDPKPLVIYHGRSCPDGFAAALAAWLYYDGLAEFLALDHGDVKTLADLPPVAGRAVYVLDFSFAEPLLREIDAAAAKLVVLDHHLSAAEKLTGFQCQCGVVHFDMKKSGAHLAWAFFHPTQPMPDLVKYVEDRDIGSGNTLRAPVFWLRWTWSHLTLPVGKRLPVCTAWPCRLTSSAVVPWTKSLSSWRKA